MFIRLFSLLYLLFLFLIKSMGIINHAVKHFWEVKMVKRVEVKK
jgi:hypothetical protein